MNDYKELIGELREQCSRMDYDCCELAFRSADAIEQLVKEGDDEREAADEWQHKYFELARKCSQLEKARDAAIDCIYAIEDDIGRYQSELRLHSDW